MGLSLSRRADYAIIALSHMAERPGQVVSAREVASAWALPHPAVMQVLKSLQVHGLLKSHRGVKGGYQISGDLERISLCDLISAVECDGKTGEDCGCEGWTEAALSGMKLGRNAALQALQFRLGRFLKDVKLSDLIVPGRRIDVPRERLGRARPADDESKKLVLNR